MIDSLNVPQITDDELSVIARDFLTTHGHPDGSPIDIEKICDKEGVGLIIVPNLTLMKNTEAYIANKCETIIIDKEVFETQEDRARFSIAHELSHRILHLSLLNRFDITDSASYDAFHSAVSPEDLIIIEDQAYSLAGHLLMPTELLNSEIARLIAIEGSAYTADVIIERIIRALAEYFIVSADAMIRQIEKVNVAFHKAISQEVRTILVPPYLKKPVGTLLGMS